MSLAFGNLEQKSTCSPSFPLSDLKDLRTFPLGFCLSGQKKKILISVFPWPPAAPWWLLLWALPSLCRIMVLSAAPGCAWRPQARSFLVPVTSVDSGLRGAPGSSWAERALGPTSLRGRFASLLPSSLPCTPGPPPTRWDPSIPLHPLIWPHEIPS